MSPCFERLNANDAEQYAAALRDPVLNELLSLMYPQILKRYADPVVGRTPLSDTNSIHIGVFEDTDLCGVVCLKRNESIAEVGYWLHPKFHGRGLIQVALRLAEDEGHNVFGVKLFHAFINRSNERSQAAAVRAGYVPSGEFNDQDEERFEKRFR